MVITTLPLSAQPTERCQNYIALLQAHLNAPSIEAALELGMAPQITIAGVPAIIQAAANHDLDGVRALVEHGARLDVRDREQLTALHHAVIQNDLQVVSYLLDRRAPIHAVDDHRRTPLHWAAHWGYLPLVETLIEHRARVDLGDAEGQNVLDIAASFPRPILVTYLIENGCDSFVPDGIFHWLIYHTGLVDAVVEGRIRWVRQLRRIAANAQMPWLAHAHLLSLHQRNRDLQTPLYTAVAQLRGGRLARKHMPVLKFIRRLSELGASWDSPHEAEPSTPRQLALRILAQLRGALPANRYLYDNFDTLLRDLRINTLETDAAIAPIVVDRLDLQRR
ncbi:MAG TPA: ankyrin repeat domain-containing protein, partial [Opitutales bacterium]|nr:ankyrin repeat domain-containing protein [Opitutales bacterium]